MLQLWAIIHLSFKIVEIGGPGMKIAELWNILWRLRCLLAEQVFSQWVGSGFRGFLSINVGHGSIVAL